MATSGGRRDARELRDGFARWANRRGEHLVDLTHVAAGLSNETLVATFASGARTVVRLPPLRPSFPDHDLATEAAVIDALAAAGIPTPAPASVELDDAWLGTPFLTMRFVEGHIPGAASVFDTWLTEAEPHEAAAAQDAMVGTLAALHALGPSVVGLPELRGRAGGLADEVAWWRRYLDWATDGSPRPRFAAIIDWCAETCPTPTAAPSALWGDARLENLVFDPARRVAGILDWELASIGPAECDLGWYLGLERVLRELTGGLRVPGFLPDDEVVRRYEAALGRPVEHLAWHQVFAVVRSICINVRQASIAEEAGIEYLLPADERNPLLGVVEAWIARFVP